jgi:pyruvate formate lyase activating enzyme
MTAAQQATLDATITGTVFNIQRYSLHDGPGIRTTVFLTGCPLACDWCSNPESQSLSGALMHNPKKCLRCGRCAEVCPEAAIRMTVDGPVIDRERCDLCGICVDNCVPHALRLSAKSMSVQEVVQVVERDRAFYRRSGGGMTLSGGEPLLQPDFARDVLRACRDIGIDTALETAGHVPWAALEEAAPWVDHLLFDVKHLDSDVHRRHTGVRNTLILENLRRVMPLARQVIVRIPVIPGFNGTDAEIRQIAEFARELGVEELHLLPYHRLGQAKYSQMGLDYACEGVDPLTKEREGELAALVRAVGLTCRIRG